jgi:hypothetical protein
LYIDACLLTLKIRQSGIAYRVNAGKLTDNILDAFLLGDSRSVVTSSALKVLRHVGDDLMTSSQFVQGFHRALRDHWKTREHHVERLQELHTRFAFALHTISKLLRNVELFVGELQHEIFAYCRSLRRWCQENGSSSQEYARTKHLERLSEAKSLRIKVHKPLVGLGTLLTHGAVEICYTGCS